MILFEKNKIILASRYPIQPKELNFDTVCENIIVQIGGIQIEQGNTLDEQLAIDERKIKLQKQIDSL